MSVTFTRILTASLFYLLHSVLYRPFLSRDNLKMAFSCLQIHVDNSAAIRLTSTLCVFNKIFFLFYAFFLSMECISQRFSTFAPLFLLLLVPHSHFYFCECESPPGLLIAQKAKNYQLNGSKL